MTTIEDVRALVRDLPRSYEVLVRDRVKFRVGQIVYLAFSADEEIMGFAFPKAEREALVASEPNKFLLPRQSDLRFNWVEVRFALSTRSKCANSFSTRGAWSCQSASPPNTSASDAATQRSMNRYSPTTCAPLATGPFTHRSSMSFTNSRNAAMSVSGIAPSAVSTTM